MDFPLNLSQTGRFVLSLDNQKMYLQLDRIGCNMYYCVKIVRLNIIVLQIIEKIYIVKNYILSQRELLYKQIYWEIQNILMVLL